MLQLTELAVARHVWPTTLVGTAIAMSSAAAARTPFIGYRSALKVPDDTLPSDVEPIHVPEIVSATNCPTCLRGVTSTLASKSITFDPLSEPLTRPPRTLFSPV